MAEHETAGETSRLPEAQRAQSAFDLACDPRATREERLVHAARCMLRESMGRVERSAREVSAPPRIVELFRDATDLVDEALVSALERFKAHG